MRYDCHVPRVVFCLLLCTNFFLFCLFFILSFHLGIFSLTYFSLQCFLYFIVLIVMHSMYRWLVAASFVCSAAMSLILLLRYGWDMMWKVWNKFCMPETFPAYQMQQYSSFSLILILFFPHVAIHEHIKYRNSALYVLCNECMQWNDCVQSLPQNLIQYHFKCLIWSDKMCYEFESKWKCRSTRFSCYYSHIGWHEMPAQIRYKIKRA